MKKKNETVVDAEQSLKQQQKAKKRKKVIKKAVIYCVVLALIVYGLFAYNFKLKNSRWPWQSEVLENSVDQMVKTQVYESIYSAEIDISGYVEAYKTQDVMIRASGAVTGVYVKEGDRVKEGQLLAEIDSTSQSYNVSNLEWQVEKAKISQNSSAKELELMEMQLANAKQNLENTKAYANFDGVVVSVFIDEGDYFNAGSSAIIIIDDSKLKASVEVDEIDVQLLEKGMTARVSADSVPGEIIEGKVSYIPMIGRYSNQGIGVMDVEITIDEPPASLKPGFSFEGTISVESEQTILLVSQSAVQTTRGSSTVTKLNEDGTTETVPVTVKYLGENLYQIVDGDIKAGDTVVFSRGSSSADGLAGLLGGFDMGGMPGGMSGGGFSGGGMPSGMPSGASGGFSGGGMPGGFGGF